MIRTLRFLFCILLLHLTLTGRSQNKRLSSLKIVVDTAQIWFASGVLPIGAEITYHSGMKRRTTGYLNGNLRWQNMELVSDQGKLNGDVFLIDLEKARLNMGKVEIMMTCAHDTSSHDKMVLHLPKLERIALLIPEDIKLKPGTTFTPDMSFYYSNGQEYVTAPWKPGSFVKGESLRLFYNKTELKDGLFQVPNNLIEAGDFVTLSAVWKEDPQIYDVKIYAIDYDFTESFKLFLPPALDGKDGRGGGDDQNGVDGGDGFDGMDAPDTELFMWLSDSTNTLHVQVTVGKEQKQFSLNPGIGKFELDIRGGKGGNGGQGGRGGDAGINVNSLGGIGGNGGNGGVGGKGAKLIIFCDVKAEKYLPQIHINNLGGEGGAGGMGGLGGRVTSIDNSSFFDVVFPTRNDPGYQGWQGEYGPNGQEAEIQLLNSDEVKAKREQKK